MEKTGDCFQTIIKKLKNPPLQAPFEVKEEIKKLSKAELEKLWGAFLGNFDVVVSPILTEDARNDSRNREEDAMKKKQEECGVTPCRAKGRKKRHWQETKMTKALGLYSHWKSHADAQADQKEEKPSAAWACYSIPDLLHMVLAKNSSLHCQRYVRSRVKTAGTKLWAKEVEQFLLLLLELAHYVIGAEDPQVPLQMVCVIDFIQRLLPDARISQDVKGQLVSLCKLWLKRNIFIDENIIIQTFQYTVKKSLKNNALKADIHNVWSFREVVKRIVENEKIYSTFKSDLLEIVINKKYLKNKEGCNFIGYMMTVKPDLTLDVHEIIKERLTKIKEGDHYGKIYYYAWHNSNPEVKQVIERRCIQFYMLKAIMLPRSNLTMSVPGHNALRILSHFHRQQFAHVKKMLSSLYAPILWRNLSSPNNVVRCNAAEVLFDAYPLEKPGEGRQTNEVYKNQQHDEITALLTDKCHIVRIIAIRQVCSLLACYWEAVPVETIQKWMKFIGTLANDFSSLFVRRSVFKGLPKLLSNPHALIYLETALPYFKKNFHDPNEQVRSAFVDMLIAIKKSKQTLKFWRVVPLEEIVERLEVESELVGSKIVDLLFDSFFAPHFDGATVIMRLLHLISINPAASLKFFFFSKRRVSLERAVEMMLHILTFVRGYVKNKLESAISVEPVRKKKRLYCGKENEDSDVSSVAEETLSTTATTTVSATNTLETTREMPLDNLEVCKTFLEIAGIIWCIHAAELEKPENVEFKKKIYGVCESSLNLLLRYYKNHVGVYSAVLGICSFMPLSRLKFVSTVESSCLSQLKQMSLDAPPDRIRMFLVPLCMWGRGADIIELVREWLKDSFKASSIGSVGRRSSSSRRKLVNFKQVMAPKPRLGLVFIDTIISIPRCRNCVLAKHSEEVVQLWFYMGNVKELIDKRLQRRECFEDGNVSDTFLLEYFDLYLTLMIALDGVIYEEQPLNTAQELKLMLTWATETVLPHVPSEVPEDLEEGKCPLAVAAIHTLMKYTSLMMPMGKVDLQLLRCEAVLVRDSLNKGCRLMFVFPACVFIGYLMEYIKITDSRDQLHLFRRVTLHLVKLVMFALSEKHMDQVYLKMYIEDLGKIKTVLNEVLSMSQKLSPKLLEAIMVIQVESAVNIIKEVIATEDFEKPIEKIHCLPYMAAQITTMFLSRVSRGNNFCNALRTYFQAYKKEDPTYLLAALNLFHAIVHSKTKATSEDLLTVFHTAKDAFKLEVIKQRSAHPDQESELEFVIKGKKVVAALEEKLLGRPVCDAVEIVQNLLEGMRTSD